MGRAVELLGVLLVLGCCVQAGAAASFQPVKSITVPGIDTTERGTDRSGCGEAVPTSDENPPLESTDSDADGLGDAREETVYGTNPCRVDTDGDGLSDGTEVTLDETNPTSNDTDGDGIPDGRERAKSTSPVRVDTDGDGVFDGEEVRSGTDPADVTDRPPADNESGVGLQEAGPADAHRSPDLSIIAIAIGLGGLLLALSIVARRYWSDPDPVIVKLDDREP